jgi:glycosyltransferase involved in cell wall biosynthesis
MAARKVIHILSSIEKSLAFEWLLPRLAQECDLKVVLLNPDVTPLETFLRERSIPCHRITLRGKRDFPMAFLKLLFLLHRLRPEVVHVHLLDAQRLALPAAWLTQIKKRIYTRHTSTFHHRYAPAGVKYDKLSNRLATHIISISQATDQVLLKMEDVPQTKLVRIPHGFDFEAFGTVTGGRVEALRHKWNIPRRRPVIGLVSRFIEWKGLQFALPAITNFQKMYPEACVVLANAQGPFSEETKALLAKFSTGSVICIPFEEDSASLFSLFDIFIHVPVDEYAEAFGQVYIEALALGIPSIFTRSGIAAEFIEDRKNALVVPFRSVEAITLALNEVWSNNELRKELILNGRQDVILRFGIDSMIRSLVQLYEASDIL